MVSFISNNTSQDRGVPYRLFKDNRFYLDHLNKAASASEINDCLAISYRASIGTLGDLFTTRVIESDGLKSDKNYLRKRDSIIQLMNVSSSLGLKISNMRQIEFDSNFQDMLDSLRRDNDSISKPFHEVMMQQRMTGENNLQESEGRLSR